VNFRGVNHKETELQNKLYSSWKCPEGDYT